MDSFGNKIEIQQGEDWNMDVLVSASNREYIPFIVSSERRNPYFVLTVASTKYEKNMRYVASWWNEPEGKNVGDSLPTFYQTTPVDIGVLDTAPTSSFQPDDIPEEYQTDDESAEKRYLYQYMLESEEVDEKLGHRPYHYLYFEYPEITGRLAERWKNRFPAGTFSSVFKIFFGVDSRELHDSIVNRSPSTFSRVVDVGVTTNDNVKAYLTSEGVLYVLTSDFDTPLVFPENCYGMVNNTLITEVHFNNTDLSKVTNMSEMFLLCANLTSANLAGVHIDNCEKMDRLFTGCASLQRVYVNDTFLAQVEEKLDDGTLSTKGMFYQCPQYDNPNGYLTGRDGYWTTEKNSQYGIASNLPYEEIYDCTTYADDTSSEGNVPICHVDEYECYIRFNLDSDITGEWNGQDYKYAITLVDGPTLADTLETIAMSNNGGVLPEDYPTTLEAQYLYVTVKYPNQLGKDIDVDSPIGKIEHPEPILTPTDLKVYSNLRKLI